MMFLWIIDRDYNVSNVVFYFSEATLSVIAQSSSYIGGNVSIFHRPRDVCMMVTCLDVI